MASQPPGDWPGRVLHFWFAELDARDWFSARAAIDALIRQRFGELHAALARDPPAADALDALGHVAVVVVFDQFSRNLFRKSPQAFATDALAQTYATRAVEAGLDAGLSLDHRQFLYMPFMHSEDSLVQARSVALFAALGDAELLGYAQRHQEIIDRFGRFPHRNDILKRVSTPQETEFLRTARPFA